MVDQMIERNSIHNTEYLDLAEFGQSVEIDFKGSQSIHKY